MGVINSSIGIKAEIKKAGKKAEFSLRREALTRIGYGTSELIYFTIGLLAAQVALEKDGAVASPQKKLMKKKRAWNCLNLFLRFPNNYHA